MSNIFKDETKMPPADSEGMVVRSYMDESELPKNKYFTPPGLRTTKRAVESAPSKN